MQYVTGRANRNPRTVRGRVFIATQSNTVRASRSRLLRRAVFIFAALSRSRVPNGVRSGWDQGRNVEELKWRCGLLGLVR